MRILKTFLFSVIALLTVFSVILAFILISYTNQDYQQLLTKTVDNLSSYTLSINGNFEFKRTFTPVLSASGIELHSKTDASYIHIDNFRIQVTLASLLNDTLLINDLFIENMRVESQSVEETSSINLAGYLPVPIIEHALLKNIQLLSGSDDQVHTLDSLLITAKDKHAPLELQGTGILKGHIFDIEGQLGPLADIIEQKKRYPLKFSVSWKQVQLLLSGTIADVIHGKGLDLVGKISIPEIADIFATKIPVKGRLHARAQITGAFAEPVLADIQAVLLDKQLTDLQISGSIGNLRTMKQTDLHLGGFIQETELLAWILPESAPSINKVAIETDISTDRKGYLLQNINVNLSTSKGLNIILTGNSQIVQDEQPFRDLDIQAKMISKDTTTVKPYLGNILPEMGPVQGTARITTLDKEFVISQIDLLIGVDKKVQLTAKGQVGALSAGSDKVGNEIALALTLKAQNSTELSSLLKIVHPEIGPVTMQADLKGSVEKLSLDDIQLHAGHPGVLSIVAYGNLSWDNLESDTPKQSTDVTVQIHSPSINKAAQIYDIYSPNLGAADVSMRLHGSGMVLTGSDIAIRIGTKNSLLFKVQGRVAQIFIADFIYKGIELSGNLTGKSTSSLSELLENKKIPDIGPITGKIAVTGDSDSLNVPHISLAAGRKKSLMLKASGQIAEIPPRRIDPPRGVNIDLAVTAPNSTDLSVLLGSEIPDLGALSIKGLLTRNNGMLAINDLELKTGDPAQPDIRISGKVDDLLSRHGVQIKFVFDEKTLVKLFGLDPMPELGSITGSAVLSNAQGSFSIQDLTLELGNSELISLKIIGAIEDVANSNEVSANVDIAIKQPELVGDLFAVDLTGVDPVSASGLISGNKSRMAFKGNSIVGRTRFSNDLAISFINKQPLISGTIDSPNLFLKDFGLISEVTATEKSASVRDAKQAKKILFNTTPIPLQALHAIDLKLKLRLFKISGIDYQLDKAHIDLFLQNGRLTANPVTFNLSEGEVSLQAEVDSKIKPEWSLNINGDNIQLGEIFEQQGSSSPFSGKLNLAVNLTASGISEHEIVANLNGEAGFTLENGGINRSQLELVFLNPIGWLFSYGINHNELQISCGLATYQVKQGMVKSKVFLIDGPKFLTRGQTEANLVDETINSIYHLQKKNIFHKSIMPTFLDSNVAIEVTGNLADPTVKEAPLTSVGSKADRYIFAPVATVPRELLGTVVDIFDHNKKVQSPCSAYLEQ